MAKVHVQMQSEGAIKTGLENPNITSNKVTRLSQEAVLTIIQQSF